MMKKKISQKLSLATRAIHGKQLFAFKGPVATPIYQTSTYRFETSEDAIRYAKGDPSVYVYSRYTTQRFITWKKNLL
jgi:O-acetylhomoserine/O-acetylserine sulfhydrylase-like pyridoxal-dependent enzyme